jgi:hypothetical protein
MQETPTPRRTAMRWKITIEGMDEFGGCEAAEMVIEKEFSRLAKLEIGLTLSDGKTIMACLQEVLALLGVLENESRGEEDRRLERAFREAWRVAVTHHQRLWMQPPIGDAVLVIIVLHQSNLLFASPTLH